MMESETLVFVQYMKEKHGITVDYKSAELGWESVTLYHEEIDEDLFPKGNLVSLPDPLLFLIVGHDDEEGHEWIFALIVDDENPSKWYSAYCLKDEEIIDTDIPFQKYLS